MTTPRDASVTGTQALAWRLERHLLDPVGSDSVAELVRRQHCAEPRPAPETDLIAAIEVSP